MREDLLRGVLGADLVGFQTASYARHFRWVFVFCYSMLDEGFRFLSYRSVSFLRITMTLFILPLIRSILPRGVLKANLS